MYTDIKTFEDACAKTGHDPITSLPFANPADGLQIAANGFVKACIVTEALNDGWKPNWEDSSEYKYNAMFNMRGGFSSARYDIWSLRSFVSSRLCFPSAEIAIYAGKQFTDIFKQFMVL